MDSDSNSEKTLTRCFLVSGKVQGVWFRASTRQEAEKLGITGYAKNLQNGSVEVLMQGNSDSLSRLEEWLHLGSRLSKVESVVEVDVSPSPVLSSFVTL